MKNSIVFLICIIIITNLSACTVRSKVVDENNQTISTEQPNNVNVENETEASDLHIDSNDEEAVVTEPNSFTAFGETFELYESGEYYELYGQVQGIGTYYEVWNTEEILIDFGFYKKDMRIEQEGNLLNISMSCGTSCRWVKYFDVHNSRVSRFFNNPLTTNNDLVVYTKFVDDVHCVVIQNTFDPTTFYKAIAMDPAPNSAVQFEAIFIDDQHIQMTYSSDKGKITQVYDIMA